MRFIRGLPVKSKVMVFARERWAMAHDLAEGRTIKHVAYHYKRSYSTAHKVYLYHIKKIVTYKVVGLTHPDQLELPL